MVLGFAYSDKIEDIYPIKFDFDKKIKLQSENHFMSSIFNRCKEREAFRKAFLFYVNKLKYKTYLQLCTGVI